MGIDLPLYHCLRCHHTWVPRKRKLPEFCPNPKCGTGYWNKEYTHLKRITKAALAKIGACKYDVCQARYAELVLLLGHYSEFRNQRKVVAPKRKRIRVQEITKEGIPDEFKRIRHG